jgi:hypothetical protein
MIRSSLCLLVTLVLWTLTGCRQGSNDSDRSPTHTSGSAGSTSGSAGSAASPTDDPDSACKPKCNEACDVDDGCGAKCPCAAKEKCVEQVCIDPSCGPCRPNERCEDDKCQCVPDCEGRACQPDGCGHTCDCPEDLVVNALGQAVPRAQCKDTCDAAGWACGALCGVDCGACGKHEQCDLGSCECVPHCDGTSCSDGCGGTCDCASGKVCNLAQACVKPEACTDTCEAAGRSCGSLCGKNCGGCGESQACIDGQCREGLSCADCGLQLRLIDRTVINGKVVRVKLGVELGDGASAAPAPRLIDLRIAADHPAELVAATPGPSLLETGKDLFQDEVTKKSWQRRPDQSYQVLAYALTGTLRVKPGRIMTLTFDLAESGPVKFALQRHAQTFAPLDADSALQASQYDEAVVATP